MKKPKETWVLQDVEIKLDGSPTYLSRRRGDYWYNNPNPLQSMRFDSKMDCDFFIVDNDLDEDYVPVRIS